RGGADLDSVADSYENEKIASLIRTLAENRPLSSPEGLLDLVFTDTTAGNLPRLARWRDSLGSVSIAWMPMEGGALKGRFLDLNTRCVWLEPCPEEPLPGGAVPIGASFDFAGREYLMTQDLFRGIGEAPVVAVLQGKVVQVAQDSSGCISVLLEHEGNQESETRGLAVLSEEIRPGALVEQGGLLGRLSARDTTELVFQFRRNGKFVRWADFWLESHPVSDSAIAKFQKALLR
ncbi:MAG TPA: hypothetical protein VLM37_00520, partial [Fibrobacteraceae bacterium]|nr:hypothetical protein [Fibrobacteraceae bacterium]